MCVGIDDGLHRVESAVSATSCGDLSWGSWTHDCVVALGFAGRNNPLGFAVVRYLSDEPSSSAVWAVVLNLATVAINEGCSKEAANKVAWEAFGWWRDSRCRSCHGRGEMPDTHRHCTACNGTGKRSIPDGDAMLRIVISALSAAEQWMEGQLRSRLKSGGG